MNASIPVPFSTTTQTTWFSAVHIFYCMHRLLLEMTSKGKLVALREASVILSLQTYIMLGKTITQTSPESRIQTSVPDIQSWGFASSANPLHPTEVTKTIAIRSPILISKLPWREDVQKFELKLILLNVRSSEFLLKHWYYFAIVLHSLWLRFGRKWKILRRLKHTLLQSPKATVTIVVKIFPL